MSSEMIKIYDVVWLTALLQPVDFEPDGVSVRAPCIGDVATIVEVYENPFGYELEFSGSDGITKRLRTFAPSDFELKKIR
jgi:hypothetical protein